MLLGRARWLLVAALATGLCAVYAPLWGGDARVHLALAERAARGDWFMFNPGLRVSGTSSLLWLAVEAGLLHVLGVGAGLIAIKGLCCASFLALVALTARLGRAVDGDAVGFGAALLVASSTAIAAHGLAGMEATFVAALVVAGWCLSIDGSPRAAPAWAAVALLAVVARLDTAPHVVLQLSCAVRRDSAAEAGGRRRWLWLAGVAAGVAFAAYDVQHALTGDWLSVSGASRLLVARRAAKHLGWLPLHGEAARWLFFSHAPIGVGLVAAAAGRERPAPARALALAAGTVFVAVTIAGGHSWSRYLTPSYPIAFVAALSAAAGAWRQAVERPRLRLAALGLAVAWLAAAQLDEARSRLTTLSAYAPHAEVTAASGQRERAGRALRTALAAPPTGPLRLAVTEVQIRWELPDDVTVLSLDGRVDARLLAFADRRTGCADVARYLTATSADYVQAAAACDCPDSLLCRLERAAQAGAEPGARRAEDGLDLRFTGERDYWKVLR